MSDWDVLVVGGGPAGSATAARLATLGHRVLVVDRARFPRRKACGECINPAGVQALGALGAYKAVEALGPAPIRGWHIHQGDRPGLAGAYPAQNPGWGVPRDLLDAALLDHAAARGAQTRMGVRITELLRQGERVVGVRCADGEPIRARVMVGADGLRSVVLRRLNLLRRRPRLRKLAFTAHVRGIQRITERGEVRLRGRGCIGIAPVGAGLVNVVVVVPSGTDSGRDPGRFFDGALAEAGLPGAERVDAILATGPFDWPVRQAVADGALLVGDAAGYFDPFTGQGIFRALRGAELAAAAIHDALRRGDTSARSLAPYEQARRRAFSSGERLQQVIEAVVSRPRVFRSAALGLAGSARLANAVIRATGDLGWTA